MVRMVLVNAVASAASPSALAVRLTESVTWMDSCARPSESR